MKNLGLSKGKITLRRAESGVSELVISEVLTSSKLPDNAVYELEPHKDYITKKYGLSKTK